MRPHPSIALAEYLAAEASAETKSEYVALVTNLVVAVRNRGHVDETSRATRPGS